MNRWHLSHVFLSALLFSNGCVHQTQPAVPPEPRDPCLFAMEICKEAELNAKLLEGATAVEVATIQETSKILATILTKTKDPVTLARLHTRILDRLDSSDPVVQKSQQDALGEAGLNEKDIRSKVIKCEEAPSRDGGMTIHCD
jgi:hypothetical protein